MKFVCEYCGRQSRAEHSYKNHINICKANPDFGIRNEIKRNILSKQQKAMIGHYRHLYPELYTSLYSELVPQYREQYGPYGAIRFAKLKILEKLIEVDEPIQIAKGVWSCPICSLHIKDMGAHVKTVHTMDWEAFSKNYSWTQPRIFCDVGHRANLSANKLYYYNQTEAGALRRQRQSVENSGDNNPARREDVRLKISRSRKGKGFLSKAARYNISKATNRGLYSPNSKSFGYTFWTVVNGQERRFRSKIEYMIFLMLSYYNIPFQYEPYKLEYFDGNYKCFRHYMVDFISDNRMLEVKPSYIHLATDDKYKFIMAKLATLNKTLEWLTLNNFFELFNVAHDLQKPLAFFEDQVLTNIREGQCKLKFPVTHEPEFYLNSKFIKSLGENPKEILEKGELLYENKKHS